VALVLILAGCAQQPRWTYDKRGATPAQLDRDLEQCRRDAFRPHRFALRVSDRYDLELVNRCMTRRGYMVRPVEGEAADAK
jgi:hypothetical protein